MLFKTVHDYQPDSGCDDGVEAMAENSAAAPAPQSEARLRLAGLLRERSEAEAEAQKARDAIARLQDAIASPGPTEAQLAALDSSEASLIAAWSTSGGTFPTLDAARRHELEAALAECRTKAQGAQRAIRSKPSSHAPATGPRRSRAASMRR
jgi:hypothetical protein